MKLFDLLQELCNEYDSIKTVKQSVQESIKTRRGALLKGDSKHYLLHPSFPVDIRQEVYNGTGGNKTKFYRLFCFSLHDPSWSKVGWILPGELQNCMLCNCCIAASHWSFQHSKLHCYCCGNVFCKNCISGTKELMLDTNSNDCQQLGWICKLCDYGQDRISPMSNSNLGVSINNSHQSFFEDEEQFVRNHLLKEQHDSIFSLHKSNFLPKLNYWLLGSTSVEECYPSVLITARTSTKHNIVKLFICKVDSIGATRKHDLLVKFIVGDVGNEVSLENNIIKPHLVAVAMNECEVEMLCTDHLSPRSKKVVEQILNYISSHCGFETFVSFSIKPLKGEFQSMCMQICLPSSETISQIMQMKCTIIHAESTPVVNLLRWDSVEDERQDHYDNLCEEYRNELYLLQEPFYLPIDKLSLEVPRVTVDINYKETATSSHYNPTINSNGKPKCAFKSVPFTCIPVAFAEIKTFQLIATIDKLWIKKENRNVSIILSSHSAYLPGDATDLLTSSHIEFGFHFEENTRNNLINLLLPLSAKRQIIHCSDNKEAISMIRRILLQVNRRYHLSLDCFRCKLVSHRDNIRTDSMIQFSILTHSQSPCTLDSNHLIHYRSQMFNNNKYNRLSNDWFGWRRRQSHWKYIITSEMLRDIENLNTKQSLEEKLLVESRSNVSLLLGWQVAVTSCEDERAEKPSTTDLYIITATRKYLYSQKEEISLVCSNLQNFNFKVAWNSQLAAPINNEIIVEFKRKVIEIIS